VTLRTFRFDRYYFYDSYTTINTKKYTFYMWKYMLNMINIQYVNILNLLYKIATSLIALLLWLINTYRKVVEAKSMTKDGKKDLRIVHCWPLYLKILKTLLYTISYTIFLYKTSIFSRKYLSNCAIFAFVLLPTKQHLIVQDIEGTHLL